MPSKVWRPNRWDLQWSRAAENQNARDAFLQQGFHNEPGRFTKFVRGYSMGHRGPTLTQRGDVHAVPGRANIWPGAWSGGGRRVR